MKASNPDFPLIVRECEGADPYVIARYSFGVEKTALVDNLDEKQVQQVVADLVKMTSAVNQEFSKE